MMRILFKMKPFCRILRCVWSRYDTFNHMAGSRRHATWPQVHCRVYDVSTYVRTLVALPFTFVEVLGFLWVSVKSWWTQILTLVGRESETKKKKNSEMAEHEERKDFRVSPGLFTRDKNTSGIIGNSVGYAEVKIKQSSTHGDTLS